MFLIEMYICISYLEFHVSNDTSRVSVYEYFSNQF